MGGPPAPVEPTSRRFSSDKHWLLFEDFPTEGSVVGCACGFRADEDDNGYGDSVVDHIAEVAAAAERAKVLAEVEPAARDFHRAEDAEERGEGICRTCLAPIWNEGGTVRHQRRDEGWSDRIERGGDSLVCFKAVNYRHVPLTGREACIYDRAYRRAADEVTVRAEAECARLTAENASLRRDVDQAMHGGGLESGL